MHRRARFALWILLALPAAFASAPAAAQNAPGLELLRRAASNYTAAETFWIEGDIEANAKIGDRNQATTASFSVAVGTGNRLHDELDHPEVGVIRVSDGKQSWIYLTSTNQYMHRNMAEAIDLAHPPTNGGMLPVVLMNLRGMADDVDSVRVYPDESVRFEGKDRRCSVVEVKYKEPTLGRTSSWRRFWLDRDRDLVLRHRTVTVARAQDGSFVEQTETFRYGHISINQPIDPAVFTFKPPAGAKLVEQMGNQGPPDLSGQVAADFTLPDLDGHPHKLSELRGKVVMLDFWATWCGPCRRQMPLVDKLGQELKNKGLVVFAVNQGESAEVARRFLEKNKYATTALIDQGAEVGRRYQVSGIPTLVIIGRDGKIAVHYVGVHDENALREGLKKAGL